MIKKIYCFRHGQTDWNKLHKIQGCEVDNPLNETGKKQASNISKISLGAVYSSPMIRAQQTAEIYNEKLDLDIQVDDGFKEIDFGNWTGKTWLEVEKEYGVEMVNQFKSVDDMYDDFCIPGGDVKMESVNRFINTMKKAGKESLADKIGIFAHGRMLYFISNKLTQKGADYPLMDNSEYFEFEYNTETDELILIEE